MKESLKARYFALDSIDKVSRQMLESVAEFRERHMQKLSPIASALLILDMQRYFLDESSHAFIPSAGAIVSRVSSLVNLYSQHGLPIVFTRHLNTDTDAGMMSGWWRDLITRDKSSSEIITDLDWSQGVVMEKTQYDAFYHTSLETVLEDKGVSQIVICGVMTHLCCETTARSAFVRGFEVFFTVDGTATYNERLHQATLLNLAHGFAIPVLTQEVVNCFAVDE